MENKMFQSGLTKDNQIVVSDVFIFTGTHGIPLENVLYYFKENGFVVDWNNWINDALKDGWNKNTIKNRIFSSIEEVYGKEYYLNFIEKFNNFIKD